MISKLQILGYSGGLLISAAIGVLSGSIGFGLLAAGVFLLLAVVCIYIDGM